MKKFLYVLTAAVFAAVIALSAPGAWAASAESDFEQGAAAYDAGNISKAVQMFARAAGKGHRDAQYNLGVLYFYGERLEQDYGEAFKWFEKAARAGHASAQYNLALLYSNGAGVARDEEQAMYWMRQAAAQGHQKAIDDIQAYTGSAPSTPAQSAPPAQTQEAQAFQLNQDAYAAFKAGNHTRAFELFTRAAEMGQPVSQYNLAALYENGIGTAPNNQQAIYWYRASAAQGHSEAQAAVQRLTANAPAQTAPPAPTQSNNADAIELFNEGVTAYEAGDDDNAFELYSQAADMGLMQAQYNLATMYYDGEGTEKDYAAAISWLRKSAEQGFAPAQSLLALMYYNGEGTEKDYAAGISWFHKAAEQGYAEAQWWLGVIYIDGRFVKDTDKGTYWMRKAAAQGDERAQNMLREFGISW
jgi:TPR repeat protein